jgi:hypothetical protein
MLGLIPSFYAYLLAISINILVGIQAIYLVVLASSEAKGATRLMAFAVISRYFTAQIGTLVSWLENPMRWLGTATALTAFVIAVTLLFCWKRAIQQPAPE